MWKKKKKEKKNAYAIGLRGTPGEIAELLQELFGTPGFDGERAWEETYSFVSGAAASCAGIAAACSAGCLAVSLSSMILRIDARISSIEGSRCALFA